jgi:predicted alpha/beta-fold hydrolase
VAQKAEEHAKNCDRAEKLGLMYSEDRTLMGLMKRMSWRWGASGGDSKANDSDNDSNDLIQDIFHHPSQDNFFTAWKKRSDYTTYHPPFWMDLYQHIFGAHSGDAAVAAPFFPIVGNKSIEPKGESLYDFRMWVTSDDLLNPDFKNMNELKESVAVDWKFPRKGKNIDSDTKLVVLLHGLNGDSGEEYVRDFVVKATAGNCACVVVNARGMGGENFRLLGFGSCFFTNIINL